MKKIIIIFVAILLGFASILSGCVEEEKKESMEIEEGTLQLKITDAPSDLDIIYANITISNIQVHKSATGLDGNGNSDNKENVDNNSNEDGFIVDAGGDYEGFVGEIIQFEGNASGGNEPYNWTWDFDDGNISYKQNPLYSYITKGIYEVNLTVTDATNATSWNTTSVVIVNEVDEDNKSNAGWYTIVNESQTFDLMVLQNLTDILGEKNLSVGKYTQIRLTVENAVITINDSDSGEIEVHDLIIPSNNVKMTKSFWIYSGETTVLILDFDIYKSVHITGNNKFILKPTIKVIQK